MKKRAIVYIILAGILWGTSAIFSFYLKGLGFSPLQMTAMRGTVSAVLMSVYVFLKDKSLFKITLSELIWFACGGITMFLSAFLYYEAINVSSVSMAVMLMYTAPVLVTAFSVIFLGEKLTYIKVISIFCMLLGCAFITGIFSGVKFNVWGFVAGLLSGVSYSTYNIIAKIQMNKHFNPLSASVYCYLFMAVIAVLTFDVKDIFIIANNNPVASYPLMIGIGIFTVTLPYFLYTLGLKYIPVGTAASLGIIEPLMATIFGVMIGSDHLYLSSYCGIILILLSVVLLSKSKE